jgi:hypothetical protein
MAMSIKYFNDTNDIEPATLRLEAHYLNQLRHRVPHM